MRRGRWKRRRFDATGSQQVSPTLGQGRVVGNNGAVIKALKVEVTSELGFLVLTSENGQTASHGSSDLKSRALEVRYKCELPLMRGSSIGCAKGRLQVAR